MTTEEEKSKSYGLIPILILVLTNITSIGLGSYMTGDTPEPVEVTCELATQIAASEPCSQNVDDDDDDDDDNDDDQNTGEDE